MPREIVHCQVGQCGNQIGATFWEKLLEEHNLMDNGAFDKDNKEAAVDKDGDNEPDVLEKVDVYFQQTGDKQKKSNSKYVPRAVLIDLEPGTAEDIKSMKFGPIFKPDNFIFGSSGAGNNWAKGHYTEGQEILSDVLDAIRKEVEICDCLQGFQICHSIGGGTGSGFGTLLLLKIRDKYPDKMNCSFSVFPSPKVSDTVVEPYNAVLSSHQLTENGDATFVIDNEALFNILHATMNIKSPNFKQLNGLIGQVLCGISSSLRFPGQLNGDIRKLCTNLVPFPRLHFFLVAQAPLLAVGSSNKMTLGVRELVSQMYSPKNYYANVSMNDGKVIACSMIFRGSLNSQEIDDQVAKIQSSNEDDFVEWIPNNVKVSIVDTPPTTSKMSATFICNATALKGIFQRLRTQFGAMYKRKAYLHWYTGEGMDENEFKEASKNMEDLVTEYQDKQDAVAENDDDEEAEDSDDDV